MANYVKWLTRCLAYIGSQEMIRIITRRKCIVTNSMLLFKGNIFNILFLLGYDLLEFSMKDIEISETQNIRLKAKYYADNLWRSWVCTSLIALRLNAACLWVSRPDWCFIILSFNFMLCFYSKSSYVPGKMIKEALCLTYVST